MNRVNAGAGLAAGLLACGLAVASVPPAGEVSVFESPTGVAEQCVQVQPAPDTVLAANDIAELPRLCGIDFYADDVALCPKTWSTSPATIVHRADGSGSDFEAKVCGRGTHARDLAAEGLADYKMSMNGPDTSATFAPAALLYFHFSRWFEAAVQVPPAVYRSMDRQVHLQRVVEPGVKLTGGREKLAMLHAAWLRMGVAHRAPEAYSQRTELYEPGGTLAYGVLLDERGRRYGPEMNGTRASGWGRGQNEDFQRTAPFLALRAPGPLPDAIEQGLAQARRDPVMDGALRGVTPIQVAYWMRELVDITLLDFIFSQQDRIGNIDYETRWYWAEDGVVKTANAAGRPPPTATSHQPVRIRRSVLNDNDAAGRLAYANYAKTTGMLNGWRHFPAGTYRRLMRLDRDFASDGPMSEWLEAAFPLSERQRGMIRKNTALAAAIFRTACEKGELAFDLDPDAFLIHGTVTPREVRCDGS